MGKNFFDFVKDAFFNPFSNGNKRLNYDLLSLINIKMSLNNLQVNKEEIADWIVDYLDNSPIQIFDDENNSISDYKSFAFDKIRYFTRCGWLVEDYEGIKTTYQMDEVGIQLLETMSNIIKDETKTLEFSGFVYNIYSELMHFNYDQAVGQIEQIFNSSRSLNAMLRGLNVNIKKYLTKLVNENEKQPKEILYTIFYEYQKKVVLKAFRNFREVDNPSKYKNYILSKIDELNEENNFNRLIDKYIEIKCDKVDTIENREEAEEFFNERFEYVKDQFEEIEGYISMLDRKNTNYIKTAKSRLNFLLNEDTDVEGRITESLKGLGLVNDEFYEDSYFDIFSNGNLDEYSLYNPQNKKSKINSNQILESKEFDSNEINLYFEKMFKENNFSVLKINEFVLLNLKDKNEELVSNFEVNDFDDLLKILLISIYSENSSVIYEVKNKNDTFNKLGYKLDNFLVKRRMK